MQYQLRPYMCPVCEKVSEVGTNHEGEIYSHCKKCYSRNPQICVTDAAVSARKELLRSAVSTQVTAYRYDTDIIADAAAYKTLCKKLMEAQYSKFDVLGPQPWEGCLVRKLLKAEENPTTVKLLPNFVPGGQWVSFEGYRLHDWYENIFPNKKIKSGYYLEITGEMKNLVKASGSEYYARR